jgi:energy-coupling factor transporter ATP-binding protein EcfA2
MFEGDPQGVLSLAGRQGGGERLLTVKSLSFTYPEATAPALCDVSLDARAGECLCVTGPSGCGKTTLLLAMKGLLRAGTLRGEVALAGGEGTEPRGFGGGAAVGIVFQNAETQILCSTVAEEVAFGPENLCVPPREIHERVRQALRDVRLTGFASRNVERLSAGQKHRLAIASVLSMRPRLLLLDEPTSQLDGVGKSELVAVLEALKGQGYALVVVEHNLEPFRELTDRCVVMEGGRVVAISDGLPVEHARPRAPAEGSTGSRSGADRDDAPFIAVEGLHLSYPDAGEVLRGVGLAVSRGERVHLYGQNGSGKSSLLACLAGAAEFDSGSIRVAGREVTGGVSQFGTVGYLLQNPQRQLFEDTVFEEVAFSLKRLRLPEAAVREHVKEALEVCEAGHLAGRLPLSLSFGEQHRVALASVIAPRPPVLLLDEPFSGLDLAQRRRMLGILARLNEKERTTVVMASHDPLPDPGWPDRVLTLERGALA